MSSPKGPATPGPQARKTRPSTPHPTGRGFDFAAPDAAAAPDRAAPGAAFDFACAEESEHDAHVPTESCIGMSLATVLNTFRGPATPSGGRPGASPSSLAGEDEDDDDETDRGSGALFRRFFGFRSAVRQTLSCAERRSTASVGSSCPCDRHLSDGPFVSFETFEREKSLMQRAASWSTQETMTDAPSPARRGNNVHFHYPPITSVRLRARTESCDVPKLFFAPEELDEIEDDREDARAADDVETLAVGVEHWGCAGPTFSSVVTASDSDDRDSHGGAPGAGAVVFERAGGSPRKRGGGGADRRYVRGVQIMLREKSTG